MHTNLNQTLSPFWNGMKWLGGFLLVLGILMGGWVGEVSAEQLRIRSTPSGAILYINGTKRGRTPFTASLSSGRYHVEVRRAGYLTWATYLQLPQRSELTLRAKLEKSLGSSSVRNSGSPRTKGTSTRAKRGGLLIAKTVPSGISVYSDSIYLGRTPLLKFLSSGEHTLQFRQSGFRTVTRRVQISSTKSVRLTIQLSQGSGRTVDRGTRSQVSAAGSTQLMILSRPSARVYLGSRYLGRTPVISAGFSPGTFKLTLKRKGYLNYQRTLTLHAGQQVRIRARLVRKR